MDKNKSDNRQSPIKDVTLQLKEEQLVLAKKWIHTGEVKIYKELLTEEKTFTVPVEREELVIEKKIVASVNSDQKKMPQEVIRIRIAEEQVDYTKHWVILEDVSIYTEQIADIKHIEETLKREESNVKTSFSSSVSNPNYNHL